MPKKSNRYRTAAERAQRGANAPRPTGRLRRVRVVLASFRSRVRRPHPRREVVIVGGFGVAIVLGLGSLGAGYLVIRCDHDWTSVASVNGHDISREALRGRMAVLALLAQERSQFVGEGVLAGTLTSEEATGLQQQAAAATSLDAARESLIDDELLRQLAARDGVTAPAAPDSWAEATTYASADLAHRVRYVRFGLPLPTSGSSPTPSSGPSPTPSAQPSGAAGDWPAAGAGNVDAAVARIKAAYTANTPVEAIVSSLHDAGWQVLGEDVAVSAEGVPADASLDLDPSIAAATTRGSPGTVAGPTTDAYGRVSLGLVLPSPDTTMVGRRFGVDATKIGLDAAALQSWANGQTLRRAVIASLIANWSKGVNEAHFRELVIGAAPDLSGTAGPWVELSALAVDRLNGVNLSSIPGAPAGLDLGAEALARTLSATPPTDRATLFRALVAVADGTTAPASSGTSGELGFYTKDGVIPDLGTAAFADAVKTGDMIGPISTASGPELFLVESRYAGTLDERSQVALRQIRNNPAADLLAYTEQYSPADAGLATDAGWRAEPEFATSEAVRGALFDTPGGVLSDPFVLDGKLAVAVVTERRAAVPDPRTLGRLILDGYDAWLASELARATITRSDNPLPELMPSSSPSSSASASALPALPSMPALDTPNVPIVPGQPAATSVPTDAMGLPRLP